MNFAGFGFLKDENQIGNKLCGNIVDKGMTSILYSNKSEVRKGLLWIEVS